MRMRDSTDDYTFYGLIRVMFLSAFRFFQCCDYDVCKHLLFMQFFCIRMKMLLYGTVYGSLCTAAAVFTY